jgi:hypothetical protein
MAKQMKKILFLLLVSVSAFGQGAYNGAPKLNQPPAGDAVGSLVRTIPQDIDRIGFTKAISNNIDTEWGSLVVTGSGMTVNQTGGNLVITSGTTARSETIIRSTESWLGGIRLSARSTLSQRIVNQHFFVEMVDVIGDGLTYSIGSATAITVTIPSNPFTAQNVGQSVYLGAFSGTGTFLGGRYPIASVSGNDVTFTVSGFAAGSGTCSVFGWNYYQLRYQGTTATSVDFDTQRNGWGTGVTAATINTTASPGHLAVLTGNDLKSSLHDQLVASTGTLQLTARATRVENVPDDIPLRLQIRVLNLGTAPASTTTWTVGLLAVEHYAQNPVSINDVTAMNPGAALNVNVVQQVVSATQPVSFTQAALPASTNLMGDVGVQYRATTTGSALVVNLNSPATPAVQTVKGGAGRLLGFYVVNSNAATRFLKVFNATAPTLGTTSAILDIPIPPNSAEPVFFKLEGGIGFSTAITVIVTGGRGVTDNTAITLNDVTGFIAYQ